MRSLFLLVAALSAVPAAAADSCNAADLHKAASAIRGIPAPDRMSLACQALREACADALPPGWEDAFKACVELTGPDRASILTMRLFSKNADLPSKLCSSAPAAFTSSLTKRRDRGATFDGCGLEKLGLFTKDEYGAAAAPEAGAAVFQFLGAKGVPMADALPLSRDVAGIGVQLSAQEDPGERAIRMPQGGRGGGVMGPGLRGTGAAPDGTHDSMLGIGPKATNLQFQSAATGAISSESVKDEIRRHMNEVRYCFEKEQLSAPSLHGALSLDSAVSPSGQAAGVKVTKDTVKNDNVSTCLQGRVKTWKFATSDGGATTRVTATFTFGASAKK